MAEYEYPLSKNQDMRGLVSEIVDEVHYYSVVCPSCETYMELCSNYYGMVLECPNCHKRFVGKE